MLLVDARHREVARAADSTVLFGTAHAQNDVVAAYLVSTGQPLVIVPGMAFSALRDAHWPDSPGISPHIDLSLVVHDIYALRHIRCRDDEPVVVTTTFDLHRHAPDSVRLFDSITHVTVRMFAATLRARYAKIAKHCSFIIDVPRVGNQISEYDPLDPSSQWHGTIATGISSGRTTLAIRVGEYLLVASKSDERGIYSGEEVGPHGTCPMDLVALSTSMNSVSSLSPTKHYLAITAGWTEPSVEQVERGPAPTRIEYVQFPAYRRGAAWFRGPASTGGLVAAFGLRGGESWIAHAELSESRANAHLVLTSSIGRQWLPRDVQNRCFNNGDRVVYEIADQ